jgi:hypothetical protein
MRYNAFTAVRKKDRPQFIMHRKVKKKSGWMHLDCGACEGLNRAIRLEKKDSEGRLTQQRALEELISIITMLQEQRCC